MKSSKNSCTVFYDELEKAVQKSGKTWNSISKDLGFSLAGYSRGKRADPDRPLKMPGLDAAIAIADYFGLSLDEMCHRRSFIKDISNITVKEAINILDELYGYGSYCEVTHKDNFTCIPLPRCDLADYLSERTEFIKTINELECFSSEKKQELIAEGVSNLNQAYAEIFDESVAWQHCIEDESDF